MRGYFSFFSLLPIIFLAYSALITHHEIIKSTYLNEEALLILDDLYFNQKNAESSFWIAISSTRYDLAKWRQDMRQAKVQVRYGVYTSLSSIFQKLSRGHHLDNSKDWAYAKDFIYTYKVGDKPPNIQIFDQILEKINLTNKQIILIHNPDKDIKNFAFMGVYAKSYPLAISSFHAREGDFHIIPST